MTYTLPKIDGGQALEFARTAGRVSWRIAKSAAFLSGNVVGVGLGLIAVLICYGVIIAPDALWWRLARHYPENPGWLDPKVLRSVALVAGALGIAFVCDCVKAIERWIDATFRAPKGV